MSELYIYQNARCNDKKADLMSNAQRWRRVSRQSVKYLAQWKGARCNFHHTVFHENSRRATPTLKLENFTWGQRPALFRNCKKYKQPHPRIRPLPPSPLWQHQFSQTDQLIYESANKFFNHSVSYPPIYRGTDKSLARPDWKKQSKGRFFSSDAEVIAVAETWLDGQPSDFFFLSDLQKLEFGRCSFFLPDRAKDLSALRYCFSYEVNNSISYTHSAIQIFVHSMKNYLLRWCINSITPLTHSPSQWLRSKNDVQTLTHATLNCTLYPNY